MNSDIKSDIKRMEDKFIELSSKFDKLMDMFTTFAIADKNIMIDNEGLNTIKPKLSYGSGKLPYKKYYLIGNSLSLIYNDFPFLF